MARQCLVILFAALPAAAATCTTAEAEAELLALRTGCGDYEKLYNSSYSQLELQAGLTAVCDGGSCATAWASATCSQVLSFRDALCADHQLAAAHLVQETAFQCVGLASDACSAAGYCELVVMDGMPVCLPALESPGLVDLIPQVCSFPREAVIANSQALHNTLAEDPSGFAGLGVRAAFDFYCGKDEAGVDYFPTNCPCEFADFSKLHTYSKLVADGFGKAPLLCAGDETGDRMKRAFAVNSAGMAAWKLLKKRQELDSCVRGTQTPETTCAAETLAVGAATKYRQATFKVLDGMCVKDTNGTEASEDDQYCMHFLAKGLTLPEKQCLLPLVLGQSTTCSGECDALLAPKMAVLTGGCCGATLEKYFGPIYGGQFLQKLSVCSATAAHVTAERLAAEEVCADVFFEHRSTLDFCLPVPHGSVQDFLGTSLEPALLAETARSLGVLPRQVSLTVTASPACRFGDGSAALAVHAVVEHSGAAPRAPSGAKLAAAPGVASALAEHGCPDCARGEELSFEATTVTSAAVAAAPVLGPALLLLALAM